MTGATATDHDLTAWPLCNLDPIGISVPGLADVGPEFDYKSIVLLLGAALAVVRRRAFELDALEDVGVGSARGRVRCRV